MSIENVRVETIDESDPRFAEIMAADFSEDVFVQDKHGAWYVRGTNEPVSFATHRDEARYKQGTR